MTGVGVSTTDFLFLFFHYDGLTGFAPSRNRQLHSRSHQPKQRRPALRDVKVVKGDQKKPEKQTEQVALLLKSGPLKRLQLDNFNILKYP